MDGMLDRARSQLLQRHSALRARSRANLALASPPEGDEELGEDVRRELNEVEAALRRIEEGTFGWCERCGGAIGRNRLRALPAARLCITCSAERSLDSERR